MDKGWRITWGTLLAAGWAAVSATCWHSVEEIHYLKTFFPRQFTVEGAYQATIIELVKVGLIVFPVLMGMGLILLLWRVTQNQSPASRD